MGGPTGFAHPYIRNRPSFFTGMSHPSILYASLSHFSTGNVFWRLAVFSDFLAGNARPEKCATRRGQPNVAGKSRPAKSSDLLLVGSAVMEMSRMRFVACWQIRG